MAWLYVKRKGDDKIYKVADTAFGEADIANGFEIVPNAENSNNVADKQVVSENVQPAPEKPVKRQYRKRSEA